MHTGERCPRRLGIEPYRHLAGWTPWRWFRHSCRKTEINETEQHSTVREAKEPLDGRVLDCSTGAPHCAQPESMGREQEVLNRSRTGGDLVQEGALRIRFDGDHDDHRRPERLLPHRLTLARRQRRVTGQHFTESSAGLAVEDEETPGLREMVVRRPNCRFQQLFDQFRWDRIRTDLFDAPALAKRRQYDLCLPEGRIQSSCSIPSTHVRTKPVRFGSTEPAPRCEPGPTRWARTGTVESRAHHAISWGRYCNASATWAAAIRSDPARSAMVRANLSTR